MEDMFSRFKIRFYKQCFQMVKILLRSRKEMKKEISLIQIFRDLDNLLRAEHLFIRLKKYLVQNDMSKLQQYRCRDKINATYLRPLSEIRQIFINMVDHNSINGSCYSFQIIYFFVTEVIFT